MRGSFYQMGIILLITLPALRSMEGRPVFWGDAMIAGLMLLFMGSSNFSEKISSGKYPEYAAYRKHLPV